MGARARCEPVGEAVVSRCLLGLVSVVMVVIASDAASAGAPSAADIAWIDKCIADRAIEKNDPVKLRKYCVCMQEIVEDNEPFTVTELERSYPPAHVMCMDEAGLLR
jgi:hypothetical protein